MIKKTLIDITIADVGCIPCVSPDENGDITIKNDAYSYTVTKEDIINKGICFHYKDEDGFTFREYYKLIKGESQ